MKKIYLIITIILAFSMFTGCTQTNSSAQNSQVNINSSLQASTAEQTIEKSEAIIWKNYDKKYASLSGIKFPSSFYLDGTQAIEIRSTEIPLIKNNECFFTSPCSESGLMIGIGLAKPMSDSDLEDTKYPAIKKVNMEKVGAPLESIQNYHYQEYLYISKNKNLPYLIQIYEKDFKGDSTSIIDEILSSLHE